MAISKQQPMRPALNDVLNSLNETLENVSNLAESLASETQQRISEDETLGNRIVGEAESRYNAVVNLQNQIGDGFSETDITQSLNATNDNVTSLTNEIDELTSHCIRGISEEITVPANNSVSTSIVFEEPFSETALCGVFPCVISGESLTLFELTVTGCTYSGFSFQVTNSDSDPHDIYVGYIAVAFDIQE